jgi:hypothetical protein
MRAAASFNKIAGFPKISSYKNVNKLGPGMLAMGSQFESMLDRMSNTFEDLAETRKICISQSPTASHTLRKESLMIRMVDGATKDDRLRVMNTILAVIEEASFLTIDLVDHQQRLLNNNQAMQVFNVICSVICFLLGTFQLIQTVGANIKESMWELGVLRSMGLQNH